MRSRHGSVSNETQTTEYWDTERAEAFLNKCGLPGLLLRLELAFSSTFPNGRSAAWGRCYPAFGNDIVGRTTTNLLKSENHNPDTTYTCERQRRW